MKESHLLIGVLGIGALLCTAQARIITVTTVNNVNPPAGTTSLKQALTGLQAGDVVQFNIPGAGPHYLLTPVDGYPLITVPNVTIDGYSQPGAQPNSAPILAANNAAIKIVLDSRNGNSRLMDFAPTGPNDDTGYGDTESAILGVLEATNVVVQGLCLLGIPVTGPSQDVSMYGVSFAKGASGRVSGCWIGVDLDRTTLAGTADGITGFRYRVRNEANQVIQAILIENVIIGVEPRAANPNAQFNVICGIPAIPIILESQGSRISGNFLNVFPDGLAEYNPAFDPNVPPETYEGAIEIGRGGNNTLIGTDGDGVNDAQERNVLSGTVPPALGGYDHNIEFYGQNPGTNIVIAGNLIGVGVDLVTTFRNGVPAVNAAGGSAQYRIGSNLDGVSDEAEANIIYNNLPVDLFPPADFFWTPGDLNFFDEISTGAIVTLRGNVLVNNFPFPVSPMKGVGQFLKDYYAKALVNVEDGVVPVLKTNTTIRRLVGTVPLADAANWPTTIIDLYAADPMGIASGIEAAIPEIPFFVQGKAYVASFVDNSAADRNPARGAFDFDLTGLDLKGTNLTITANYVKGPAGTANPLILTSPFSDPVEVVYTPGSLESIGLRRIVADTIIINQGLDSLDNWEPYSSVLGNSTFLIECNAFAEPVGGNQRFVVGAQPVNGGPMALLEAFYADNGQPFTGQINASRQNGNPGRVAGDKRPGAVNYITGAEASPHVFAEFQSDNRWNLGMDRLVDGRYGTVQTFTLNVATLQATSRCKAFDSANGRLTSGTAAGNQITRFGGEVAGLDNGNFVSVVEDRSRLRNPDGNCVVATIIAPDGTIVKDSWVVANGDIWSNVAACQGGFVVRASGVLYFHDNAGNLLGTADQNTSGQTFDRGRGDGFRIAGHINSPYVFLGGRMSDGMVKVLVWDTRNRSFVGLGNVSEGAFSGGFDRVNLGVDALNRVTVGYVSQPAGYEQQQVAARVLALDAAAGLVRPLTPSFLPFINSGPTGGFRSLQMTVSMTTRQIMVAAKGELNLSNRPEEGANSPRQMNFYTVFAHPAPADDPTTPVGGPLRIASTTVSGGSLTITWTGGVGPFQVQKKASLSDASWGGVQTTANRTITVPASGSAGFFRIVGQ